MGNTCTERKVCSRYDGLEFFWNFLTERLVGCRCSGGLVGGDWIGFISLTISRESLQTDLQVRLKQLQEEQGIRVSLYQRKKLNAKQKKQIRQQIY
jgi:hypothetical protein